MEVDKHHALAHYISFNATEKNVDTLLPPKLAPAKYSSLATKMQSQGQLLEVSKAMLLMVKGFKLSSLSLLHTFLLYLLLICLMMCSS